MASKGNPLAHTFRASHCGQTFEGAEGGKALEAHMRTEHKLRPMLPGSNARGYVTEARTGRAVGNAPGWHNGEMQGPTPWKAPRAPKDTSKLAAILSIWNGANVTYPVESYEVA